MARIDLLTIRSKSSKTIPKIISTYELKFLSARPIIVHPSKFQKRFQGYNIDIVWDLYI